MLKFKKKYLDKILLAVYLISFFALTIGFLIGTPKLTNIVESKVTFFGNQTPDKPKPLSQVAGVQTRGIEIINNQLEIPKFSATAVLAQDFESGQILFDKNIQARLSPASTTKIMTAIVSSEHFHPGDVLVVPPEAMVSGSTMGLKIGERLSYRSLLYGMMLNSGNDAAYTIAANYPGGVEQFVLKMNEKAQNLGLGNTNFQNPAGFDGPNHYASAFDLAKLSKVAELDSQVARVVSTKETSVISWDKTNQHVLKNLNKLLTDEGFIGIKTGYTEEAGENFVGLVERDGKKVLTVVLQSSDRFGETKSLVDWVFKNYTWKEIN